MTLSSPAARRESKVERQALTCLPVAFGDIPRAAWDRLLVQAPAATPFSRWTVHRAWWDAYGATAHEQYLVCVPAGTPRSGRGAPAADEIRAIVPLMHRHEMEPEDVLTATVLRRHAAIGTAVPPDAKAVFFGASYHADYATLLCPPAEVAAAAEALARALADSPDAEHGNQPWDVVDLRRLRRDDPALPALETSFRAQGSSSAWDVVREVEDVCPVVDTGGGGWDEYLARLDKKARHEIRRKIRRAEAAGGLELTLARPTPEALDRFIALHQARFGALGLFPDTEGGRRSRQFVHRLAELEAAEPDGGLLQLAQAACGGRLIFAALAFDDGETVYLYNAGMDPAASELSPGVTGTAAYLRDRIEAGRRRFDFLRGDEPYKYEWGAVDEPIERLLVLRRDGR